MFATVCADRWCNGRAQHQLRDMCASHGFDTGLHWPTPLGYIVVASFAGDDVHSSSYFLLIRGSLAFSCDGLFVCSKALGFFEPKGDGNGAIRSMSSLTGSEQLVLRLARPEFFYTSSPCFFSLPLVRVFFWVSYDRHSFEPREVCAA